MPRMVGTQRITTADELFAMGSAGHRYELVHGELREMTPAGFRHGKIQLRMGRRLGAYVEQHDLGCVVTEVGFLLERNPDLVRAPDVAFVVKERLPEEDVPITYWPGAPDLCAEVVSPNDTYADVQEKACEWIRHGARIVFVVEPERRRVAVHMPAKDVQILHEDDFLDGGGVVPGWRLQVAELFG